MLAVLTHAREEVTISVIAEYYSTAFSGPPTGLLLSLCA